MNDKIHHVTPLSEVERLWAKLADAHIQFAHLYNVRRFLIDHLDGIEALPGISHLMNHGYVTLDRYP